MTERPLQFVMMPLSVLYDKSLSGDAKTLYVSIVSLSSKDGFAWASNRYFAEMFGVNQRTVQRWISELIHCGYITLTFGEFNSPATSRRIYPKTPVPVVADYDVPVTDHDTSDIDHVTSDIVDDIRDTTHHDRRDVVYHDKAVVQNYSSLNNSSLNEESYLPSVDSYAPNADAPRKPVGKVAKSPKGKTRIPADFEPSQSNLEWWSRQDAPAGIDPAEETEKFRDHHVAKGTVFADHQAAWRTWMRNAIKFSRNSPPQPKEQQKVKGYDPTKDMLSPLYVKPKPKLNLDDMIFKVLNNYENCVFYAGWTFRDCWNSMNKRFQDRTGWTAEQIEAYANTDEYRQAEKRARNWNDSPNAKRQTSVIEPMPLPVPRGQESFGTASAER